MVYYTTLSGEMMLHMQQTIQGKRWSNEEGIFVEKFGMKEIYRPADLQREDLSRKVRAFLEIANNPELVDFLDDTRREYNMQFIKVQIEMLLTGASKHEDKS